MRMIRVGLLLLVVISLAKAQEILTETNTNGTYTTGNRNDFPSDLSKMAPNAISLPMLLDNTLYERVTNFQDIKNNFVVDFSNIDPKYYGPELPTYTLSVQRRGIPFFYVAKICFLALLMLLIARIMYGYTGGFRSEVKIIRKEKKRIANKVMVVGIFFFILFSFSFFTTALQSIKLTDKYFAQVIVKYAEDSRKTLADVIKVTKHINSGVYPAYYSQFEFDKFHLSPLLGPLIAEADNSIKKAKEEKRAIETYHQRHIKWCIVIIVCSYLSIIAFKYAYLKRKKMVSLCTAFFLLGLAAFGFITNGFYYNFATVKVEMCEQSTQVIARNFIPFYGNGIASIVTSFSTDSKTRMREQIYEFNIGINTLYIMYMNRLKTLKLDQSFKRIENGNGVWELFLDFGEVHHKDPILVNIYGLLRRFWRMYYQVASLLESRNLKTWSFHFSNNVCRSVLAWDSSSFGTLFLTLGCVLVIAMGGWMNEWIILCIIYEEGQFLNVEKYRYDWL